MEVTDLVNISPTGYFFADYPTFLAWLQEVYRGIYGADIYIEPDSQDGQYIAVLAKAFFDTAAVGASDYNSFPPTRAQGTGLSGLVKINGLKRRDATHSTAAVDLGGTVGTSITNGVIIDILDQKWNIPDTVIPMAGTISVTATAQEKGALNAAANTINRIFTPTQGWQTVNNPAIATPGVAIETDAELRQRQTISTANPSLTVLQGTEGAVGNLMGVTDVRAYENDSGTTDGNGIPGHNVAVVVLGGDDTEIAQTIQIHKTPGVGTYGSTSVLVYDSHGMPLNISFTRPTLVTITVELTIAANQNYSSAFEPLIKAAIAEVINEFGIGETILITKLYLPAYLNGEPEGRTYDIVSLEIGKNLDPVGSINIPIGWDELAECNPLTDITVVVT